MAILPTRMNLFMTTLRRCWIATLLLAVPLAVPHPTHAAPEVDVSGFGTLGAAGSDQDFIYQRYIDDGGTLNRDSLAGIQLDARLTDAWGLTLQAKAAPSLDSDTAWEPTLSWAFLSWRPTNDLLLRVGKLRVPLMLYSANSDVGTTFDFARLPTEVYSLSPTSDVTGLSLGKTWLDGEREWTLEGYLGTAHTYWRFYARTGMEPDFPAGTLYEGADLNLGGLVLSMRDGENTWRVGVHRADASIDYGAIPTTYPFVSVAQGIGYYQVTDSMPGPGITTVDTLVNYVFTLGAEIALPDDFRLVGELVRRRITNATLGPDTTSGYLALLKRVGRWTPYIYWAGIRSQEKPLDLYDALNSNRMPDVITGAAEINASQQLGADILNAYDQQSVAIGTSYSLSPTSKIKAEWMYTRTGLVSSFVDAPSGEDSDGRQINVFSLSYSFTF